MSRREARESGAFRFWAPLIALWILPLIVFVYVLPRAVQAESEGVSSPPASSIVIGERERSFAETVSVTFAVEREQSLKLGAEGLVTAIHAGAGASAKEGRPLLSVNGTELRIHKGAAPFYRPLGSGARGPDVLELARFLTALGYSAGSGDRFGPTLAAATKAFQRDIGSAVDGTFDPSSVIYVPRTITKLGPITHKVGDRVAIGDPVGEGSVRATRVLIRTTEGEPPRIQSVPGPYKLSWHGLDVELQNVEIPDEEAERFRSALLKEGFSLTAVEGADEIRLDSAQLALGTPQTRGAVPLTALYTSRSGTQCLFTLSDAAASLGSAEAVVATDIGPLEGELATAGVGPEWIGKHIVHNPAALPSAVREECS